MAQLPSDSIDLILTDPPYGAGTANKWDSIIPLDMMWYPLKRLIKPKCPIVLTSMQPFSSMLVMSNQKMFAYEWVWRKSRNAGALNIKKMPGKSHEIVLVFCTSKCTFVYNAQNLVRFDKLSSQCDTIAGRNYGKTTACSYVQRYTNYPRDVLEIPSEGKTVHPTQKPVALMEYVINTYTNEGDTVLDFTMGSGTTGVACANLNRRFIGIELDPKYYMIAKKRIQDALATLQS